MSNCGELEKRDVFVCKNRGLEHRVVKKALADQVRDGSWVCGVHAGSRSMILRGPALESGLASETFLVVKKWKRRS